MHTVDDVFIDLEYVCSYYFLKEYLSKNYACIFFTQHSHTDCWFSLSWQLDLSKSSIFLGSLLERFIIAFRNYVSPHDLVDYNSGDY